MLELFRKINWVKILDILGWIGFFYLIIYGFLKVFGILHSPPIADAVAIGSLAFFAGKQAMRLDILEREMREIRRQLVNHNDRIIRQELKYQSIKRS